MWGWGCRDGRCVSRGGTGRPRPAPPTPGKEAEAEHPLGLVNSGGRSLPSSPGPGGAHCLGASVEHAVCENPPCPKGLPSFRDQQCQTHDRLSSKKKGLLTAVVVDGKDDGVSFPSVPSPGT